MLGYANSIDWQYVFPLREIPKLLAIINFVDIQLKKMVKPRNIELGHSYMAHLGYRKLTSNKNLSSRIDFIENNLGKLCRHC